jgi:hypothetical protein
MPFLSAVWTKIKAIFSWMAQHLLAPVVAILLVLGAVLAFVLGIENVGIGGLLGRLFGKGTPGNDPKKVIDIANSIDPDRIDKNGNLIQPGVPDSKGDTQVVVVPIDNPGPLSDPNKVTFTAPGDTKPTEVVLPDGVTAKDVEHVVIVSPTVTAITVKDNSGIQAQTVDDLLKKYGK